MREKRQGKKQSTHDRLLDEMKTQENEKVEYGIGVSGCNQLLMGTGSQLRAQDDITAGRQIRLSPRFKHLSLLAYLLWYRAEW